MSSSSDSDAPNTSSSLNPPTYSRDMPSDSTLVGYNETSQQRSLPLSSSSQALAGLSDYQYSYPQTTTEGIPKSEFVASSPKSTFVKTSLKEPRLSGGGVGVSEGKSSSSTGTESESDPGSSESTDEEDRRLKESAMRKSMPKTQNPLTPPPPSSTGLGIGDSFASSSRDYGNLNNTTYSSRHQLNLGASFATATSGKNEDDNSTVPPPPPSSQRPPQVQSHPQPKSEEEPRTHTHTHNLNNLSSGAGAFTVPPLSNIDTRAQAYSSKYEAKGMGGYIGSAQPKQVYEHLYNQQSHEQRLQIHMSSISEKYGREFRAVDDRVAGYLGRFLRRAKQGPEQERQLLQVLQVEIRDLLRRTLDSEAEVIHLTELLKESHARMTDITANGDRHLEGVLHAYEERLRELKAKVEAEANEKILAAQTKFKREKIDLEERLAFAESEMNHRLKTTILETEQRIYEREAENQAKLKTQAREAESASESFKHQLANLTSELQAEKRSFLELQDSMTKLKQAQSEEKLKVQQQLMEVVQTWEREAKSREEAVRTEMERGFSMRVAAEKEIAERHRVNEMRIQQEAFELEISKELTNLSDKYIAHHKNEVLEIRQKMTYDHEAKLSKQKNDFEDVIRSLKEEVDDALRKIKAKEQEVMAREADVAVKAADLRRSKETIGEAQNELKVREQVSWIEGMASKLVATSQEKIDKRMAKEKKELDSRQAKLNAMIMKNIVGGGDGGDVGEGEDGGEAESENDDDGYSSSSSSSSSSSDEEEKKKNKKKSKKAAKKAAAAKKKKKMKKKKKKISKYEDDSSDPEPFFDDVDQHINSILSMKEKEDSSGKARRSSLSLSAQSGVPNNFNAASRPGPYSYAGGDAPKGAHSIATDIVNPKLWGETAAAAAWMPRSFYQEYVRTHRGGGGESKQTGSRRRSTENLMATTGD
ncbi:hypothetical protein TrST_g4176 [Triparma strigata]|uniref:Uncharacterized protein n=1 Tax=Triparma strigata TaxID=1606541 RepID=A0A9W7A8J1_9STRA|nr:hypothetical protein TrST_g4176 [Triparma strigata]